MTEDEFLALGRAGANRIPLELETLADLDTPLSIYLKLANRPGSYLLESVIGGERFGRYSIVGLPARERLEVAGDRVSLTRDGRLVEERTLDDPLQYIDDYLASFRAAALPAGLRFAGGLAGYFGYDTVRYIERRLRGEPKPDPLGLPEIRLLLSEELAVVDNLSGKIHLIVYSDPSQPGTYARANRRLQELRAKLRDPREGPRDGARAPRRSQGARRAPDADRPGPQRRRPHREDRHREGDRDHDRRALLARDAHGVKRRWRGEFRAYADAAPARDV